MCDTIKMPNHKVWYLKFDQRPSVILLKSNLHRCDMHWVFRDKRDMKNITYNRWEKNEGKKVWVWYLRRDTPKYDILKVKTVDEYL